MVPYARWFAASAVLFLSCALPVHADSYSYTFTDTTDAPAVTDFTYVSPVLITTTTTFVPTTCLLDNQACSDVRFLFGADSLDGVAELAIDAPHDGEGIGFNSATDLTTIGTTTTYDGHVILTITDLSTSPVPEPSTFTLLGTGIVGFGCAVRRRFFGA